jgi:hypothetical protein
VSLLLEISEFQLSSEVFKNIRFMSQESSGTICCNFYIMRFSSYIGESDKKNRYFITAVVECVLLREVRTINMNVTVS